MRFLAALCLLSLAACASQHREPTDPDFSVDPGTQPSEPELSEVERLMRGAKRDVAAGDEGEARVKLHQVFRRDRWHPEANTLYQDLKIKLGQGDALYQEYLDLYEKNKQRGDALWFHLRPLLIKRGMKACEPEKHPPQPQEARARIEAVFQQPGSAPGKSAEPEKVRKQLTELLESESLTAGQHRMLVLCWLSTDADTDENAQLIVRYKALADENPQSGDTLAVLALATAVLPVMPDEKPKKWDIVERQFMAVDLFAQGWILELPGILLPVEFANHCHKLAGATWNARSQSDGEEMTRMRRGWHHLAFNLVSTALRADPEFDLAKALRQLIVERMKYDGDQVEDLTARR